MSDKTNPFYGETFAERKAIREGNGSDVDSKQIDSDDPDLEVEDKAVKRAATKAPKKKS